MLSWGSGPSHLATVSVGFVLVRALCTLVTVSTVGPGLARGTFGGQRRLEIKEIHQIGRVRRNRRDTGVGIRK